MNRPPAIKPMVLTRFGEPFSDPDFIFEVKHDGFRALAHVVENDCRLVSRRGHVYKSLATLCESIAADLKVEDAILDGEICCLGPDGGSQFNSLMFRRGDPHFYAFDLLWLDGQNLREWTLLDRKRELRKIVPTKTLRLLYVDHIVGRGEDLFDLACRQDLEGVIGKWKRGKYMQGERTSWIKIKNREYSQPSTAKNYFRNGRKRRCGLAELIPSLNSPKDQQANCKNQRQSEHSRIPKQKVGDILEGRQKNRAGLLRSRPCVADTHEGVPEYSSTRMLHRCKNCRLR